MIQLPPMLGWPESRPGRWALYAVFGFFASLIVFFGFVKLGQRGGETFFENLVLAVPILTASLCGIASAILSFWALAFSRERKFILVLSLTVGAFVLWFTLGELIGHG